MHPEVKMLAAVVVLFVAAGVSEGTNVTKCSLKQELQVILGAPLNATDILAKIVCHVALTSNFSTSAVNTIPEPTEAADGHRSRHRRSPKSPERVAVTSNFSTNSNNTVPHPESSEQQDSHEFRHRRSAKGPERVAMTSNFSTNGNNTVPHPESSEQQDSHEFRHRRAARSPGKGRPGKVTLPPPTTKPKKPEMWTMYGLFQLSDHVACASAQSSKPNLCGLSCQNLINNDLTDDLACVKLLIHKVTTGTDHAVAEEIKEMFNPHCANVMNSAYFSDCPQ